jgi:tol-pal system protein YbgF
MPRVTALLLLLASACWVPVERGKQMEERIRRLEDENAVTARQLDEQRAVLRERIATADQKIAEVQRKLDELNATAHRTGADVSAGQDRLAERLTRMQGQLEEDQHRQKQLEEAIAALRAENDARFAALKGAGALEQYEARKKAETLRRPSDKAAYFALAQEQEAAGEKAVARQLYDEYVKKWPTDPRAADAYFRLGEIAFGEKRYREAVLAYGKVAQDFSRSDKAPDALFRTAEAMTALGLKEDARVIYEDVVARYPASTAAKKAKTRLAELSPKGAKKKAPPPKK